MRHHTCQRLLVFAGIVIMVAGAVQFPSLAALSPADPLSPALKATTPAEAWDELDNGNRHPPGGPADWQTHPPTPDERQRFYTPYVLAMADKAKDFYTRFPDDSHATKAKIMEFQMTSLVLQWGQFAERTRIAAIGKSLSDNPSLSPEDRYRIRWVVAQNSEPGESRHLLAEIVHDADAPAEMKTAAADRARELEAISKNLRLQFTAVDGRKVDVAKLKGRVVLVDFWATWCRPCVGEVPDVKNAYDHYHAKGFDIVGISLDKEKDKLTRFVAEHQMEWPQYFDGRYWQNKYAVEFGLESIPTLLLIDKKGALRDVDARSHLDQAVQALLAE